MVGRRRPNAPRCGAATRLGTCARPRGHEGGHKSLTSPSLSRERTRERVRRSARKRLGFVISDEFEKSIYEVQAGRCAICNEPHPLHGNQGLYVDHDHDTNRIRGLVCINCNSGMGMMRDDPDRLRRAADYLDQHRLRSIDRRRQSNPPRRRRE